MFVRFAIILFLLGAFASCEGADRNALPAIQEKPVGMEGGKCRPDHSCDPGLICVSPFCQKEAVPIYPDDDAGNDDTTPIVDDDNSVPPVDDDTTVVPPDDDTTVPPVDDDTTPIVDDDNSVPPVDDDTTAVDDDTTVPPVDDDTTPAVDDDTTVVPPDDDTTVPPVDDDTTPVIDDDTTVESPFCDGIQCVLEHAFKCDEEERKCYCPPEQWWGEKCECPNVCYPMTCTDTFNACTEVGCSGHGACDPCTPKCTCDPGWTGKTCDEAIP